MFELGTRRLALYFEFSVLVIGACFGFRYSCFGFSRRLYECRPSRDCRAMSSSRSWRIAVAWLTLCVVWSSTWLAIKIGLRDLPPVSFVAIRFVIAVAVLVLVSVGRVALLPKRTSDYIVLAFTGVLMFALNYPLLFWAEKYVSSGLAAVLQASIPIFGMVFAHFLLPEEPMRWQRMLGATVALGGVALICGRLFESGGLMAFWGGLGIVVGAASAAFSNVILKRCAITLAPAMLAAWQMIFGVIPLVVLGLLVDGNPLHFHWSATAWFCLLYLAIIGSALTFLLLYWLLPRMTVTNLQTIALITPPGAVAFGWLLGGETFSAFFLVGACFVLIGVWMIFRRLDQRPAAATVGEPVKTALPRA
jgi:drug/metabolite transporter (DMT)-like permease